VLGWSGDGAGREIVVVRVYIRVDDIEKEVATIASHAYLSQANARLA
jgi:hypothetical protein